MPIPALDVKHLQHTVSGSHSPHSRRTFHLGCCSERHRPLPTSVLDKRVYGSDDTDGLVQKIEKWIRHIHTFTEYKEGGAGPIAICPHGGAGHPPSTLAPGMVAASLRSAYAKKAHPVMDCKSCPAVCGGMVRLITHFIQKVHGVDTMNAWSVLMIKLHGTCGVNIDLCWIGGCQGVANTRSETTRICLRW